MASLLAINWTAADGTDWGNAGFERVAGAAFAAEIIGGKGGAGGTASERIYRSTSYPSLTNYGVALTEDWANAVTQGRRLGIGVRVQSDGDGYFLEVDSNTNAPRIRLRRRVGGSWTNLDGGWQALTPVVGSDLNSGIAVVLKVETLDGEVRLRGEVDGTVFYDYSDTDSARIESGGTVGFLIGPRCTVDDATFDDLTVSDFESEAGGAPATGIALVLEGVYYDEAQWRAMGISVDLARQSYAGGAVGMLTDKRWFNDPALWAGADVGLEKDGARLATGVLRATAHSLTPPEGNSYELVGAKELANEVPLEDPKTGAGVMAFNVDPDNALYDDDRDGLDIGAAEAYILDNHLEGDDGLRRNKAAPPTGSPYVQADLDAMDAEIPSPQVSGNLLAAVENLASFMPEFGHYVEPDTLLHRFHQRSAAPTKDIDLAAEHVTDQLVVSPGDNRTAVLVRGSRPEVTAATFKLSDGTLGRDASFDATYNRNKGFKNRDSGTLLSFGIDANGFVYIEPATPFTMVAGEWVRVTCVITSGDAAGTYSVKSNTTSRIVLNRQSWIGSAPSVSDPFYVAGTDDPDGRNNAYNEAFRVFNIEDANLAARGGDCMVAEIRTTNPEGGTSVSKTRAVVKTPSDPTEKTRVELDTPALQPIGLVNSPTPDENACTDGGSTIADEIEVSLPVFEKDADGNPRVPRLRVPSSGFRGTAFSFDSTRWNGGAGGPARGDIGVQRTLVIDDPNYAGSAEDAEYTKMCNAILNVLGNVSIKGTITLNGVIDTSWAGLNRRVTISDSSGKRSLPSWATSGILWLLGVEYDFGNKRTVLHIGTNSSGQGMDVQAMRQRFAEKTRFDSFKASEERMNAMWECLRDAIGGGGAVGSPDPTPIGDCQISTSIGGVSGSLEDARLQDCRATTTFEGACVPDCDQFPCGTVNNPAQFTTNAAAAGTTVVEGDYLAPTMAWALRHIMMLWCALGDIAGSHDQELSKAQADFAAVRGAIACLENAINATDARVGVLQGCVNANLLMIDACMGNKLDGAGAECGLVPCDTADNIADCDFTETVCETVCDVDVPDPGALSGCIPPP